MSRIVIEEQGKRVPDAPLPDPEIDAQDVLVVLGTIFGNIAGIAIWWPSALVFDCLLCFGFTYLITRRPSKAKRK